MADGKTPKDGTRDSAHEHERTVRKGYEAARDPERQGDGDPGPEEVSDDPPSQEPGASS
jgi:hypothetical protein